MSCGSGCNVAKQLTSGKAAKECVATGTIAAAKEGVTLGCTAKMAAMLEEEDVASGQTADVAVMLKEEGGASGWMFARDLGVNNSAVCSSSSCT